MYNFALFEDVTNNDLLKICQAKMVIDKLSLKNSRQPRSWEYFSRAPE